MTKYTCQGDVRGDCGVMHRTISSACKCITRDQTGCASQGGYSDRIVRAVENNSVRPLNEEEHQQYFEESDWV
jgi:hypothetical protein